MIAGSLKKSVAACLIAAAVALPFAIAANAEAADPAEILEVGKDGTAQAPKDLLVWHGGDELKFQKPGYASVITPSTLRIKQGRGGADVVWVYDEGDFYLPFGSHKCGEKTIAKTCSVEVALHDFDGDGRPEVVVTMGDGQSLHFWVLRYYRPAAPPTYRAQRDYWSTVFEGEGKASIKLDGARLFVPLDGETYEYVLTGTKFVKK
jgi:hypothetical protein